MLIEVWKDINERYQVSNMGRVKRLAYTQYNPLTKTYSEFKEIILKPEVVRGYERVEITINNTRVKRSVHRLVAEYFIPNTDNKYSVDHINGVRDDNRVVNLRWATHSEQQRNTKKTYKVRVYNDNYSKIFNCLQEACDELNLYKANLSGVVNGKRKTTNGFKAERI